jgi:hypothetical protein
VLVAEHPNATLSGSEAIELAADLARVVETHRMASVVLTADREFARTAAREVLALEPATGRLAPVSGWRRWFR